MKRPFVIVAALAATGAVAAGAAAAPPPAPDPSPNAGPGPIRYVAYDYVRHDRAGRPVLRCHVPVRGRQRCVRIRR